MQRGESVLVLLVDAGAAAGQEHDDAPWRAAAVAVLAAVVGVQLVPLVAAV